MPTLNRKAMALLDREPADLDRATQSSLMEWATSLLNEGNSLGASLYAYAMRWEMEQNQSLQAQRTPSLTWKSVETRWSHSENGFIGRVKVFHVYWEGFRNTGGPLALRCFLPGIKGCLGNFRDMDAAKHKSERVLAHWLQMIGVTENGTPKQQLQPDAPGGDAEDGFGVQPLGN